MRVFLVRHAVAHERSRTNWPDDSLRPLTAAGKRKFRKVARGLARLLPKSAPILTSPFVRARETAGILAAVHGRRLVECQELAHGESPSAVFSLLRLRPGPAVVLIGHEPDLGLFLATAIGAHGARIAFKKGGAACIEFAGRVGAGRAALRWMVSPRILRGLKTKTPSG